MLEELKKERERLKYLINNKKNEILITRDASSLDKIFQLEALEKELDSINEKIFFNTKPVISNDIVELLRVSEDKNIFMIRLCDTKDVVGRIEYRGQHYNMMLGDVGYEIKEKFRGHNYAYQALSLLGELLYREGILDFWITCYSTNKASMKIISNYGGKFMENIGELNLYECSTKLENGKKLVLNDK